MLSTAEVQQELARVSYKPGWSFEAYEGQWEGQHIVISAQLMDGYDHSRVVDLRIDWFPDPFQNLQQLYYALAKRLARIEVHEMREFLQVDGRPLFDPHGPDAQHDRA